jgi:four helix bundle protein
LKEIALAFRSYEDLRVFQMAEKLSELVWQIVLGWKYFEKTTMGGQLVTAADSIGANIAEGAGRGTDKENQRFIRIARGSLYELKFRLGRAISRGLIKESEITAVQSLIAEIGPSLNAYLKSFTNRIKT